MGFSQNDARDKPVIDGGVSPVVPTLQAIADYAETTASFRGTTEERLAFSQSRGTDMVEGWQWIDTTKGLTYTWWRNGWRVLDTGLIPRVPTAVSGTGVSVTNLARVSFASSDRINVNGVFTEEFIIYRILIDIAETSASSQIQMHLRSGAANDSAARYNNQYLYGTDASAIAAAQKERTFWQLAAGGGRVGHLISLDLAGPARVGLTRGTAEAVDYDFDNNLVASKVAIGNTVTNQYDGFSVFPTAGTVTGSITVFGYNNL